MGWGARKAEGVGVMTGAKRGREMTFAKTRVIVEAKFSVIVPS